ncbi:MAG: PHP domain-containing protein [Deltaproteobacteria bacterium]|nr:PHP domain-containing protein [Deltaproteobacteria bacterium]
MRLDEDHHVHSTFSDGRHSPQEVVRSARSVGLRCIGFADHVRADTAWLPAYVRHLQWLRFDGTIELVIGVETKLLDPQGTLDLPEDLSGIERILVADHRLPLGDELLGPRQVRDGIRDGTLERSEVIDAMLTAYEGCLQRYRGVQLAHPLSFLGRADIPESAIDRDRLRALARLAATADACIEVSERWRCPAVETVEIFRDAGVRVRCSSDAHSAEAVGRYDYVQWMSAYFH